MTVREEAIEALIACADASPELPIYTVDDHLGASESAALAFWAFSAVYRLWPHSLDTSVRAHLHYLEAAALLRDGWCLGDPVRLVRR